jgi:signal transduction histidine kinase
MVGKIRIKGIGSRSHVAKRINFSLSLKLTIIVVVISAVVIFSLIFINVQEEAVSFENVYVDRAIFLSYALNTAIGNTDVLNQSGVIERYISDISQNTPEISTINIFTPDASGIHLYVSSASSSFNQTPNPHNAFAYEQEAIIKEIIHHNNSHLMDVIIPVNLSGFIAGTYEMVFSMDESYAAFTARVMNMVLISIVSLFVLIFSFLFFLRRIIVRPMISFRDTTRLVGQGNLDAKITINSKDEIGELSQAFNTMTDDLKKQKEKIDEYTKILEKLLDQKDEFIGQLGHDLKNPLQPLVGLLPVIVEQEKDPKIKEHLKVMNHNVEYMRDLIVKTLQLARLRSPATKFDFQHLQLSEVVKNSLDRQQFLLKDHNMKTNISIPDDIHVYADRLQLEELLNNLISNSIKYTPETGGVITLKAIETKDMIQVSLRDSGIGMTKEQVKKVFDEFYKADISSHELQSSGLGLSICKRIVEKHSGKIWVESPGPGKGSIFYFTLKKGTKEKVMIALKKDQRGKK